MSMKLQNIEPISMLSQIASTPRRILSSLNPSSYFSRSSVRGGKLTIKMKNYHKSKRQTRKTRKRNV